jgi:DNA repair exonuclease SbcCD nuclease subunit
MVSPPGVDCLIRLRVSPGRIDPENVHVIGVHSEEAVILPQFELEVWGRAHFDYKNMSPLSEPRPRSTARQVAMAHGHWVRGDADRHRAWLISDEEIAATGADYVALGHWPQATEVAGGGVPAFYSGSPDLAQTVNVIRFNDGGPSRVTRAALVDHPGG